MDQTFTLSNDDRGKVRKAITAHPNWPTYRASHGLTASDLTSARCIEVSSALGIDIQSAIEGVYAYNQPEPASEPATPPTAPAAPIATPSDDPLALLQGLRAALGGNIDAAQVKAMVDEAVAPIRKAVDDAEPVLLVRNAPDLEPNKVEGLRHKQFDTLLKAAMAQDVTGRTWTLPLNCGRFLKARAWPKVPAGSFGAINSKRKARPNIAIKICNSVTGSRPKSTKATHQFMIAGGRRV